MALTDDGANGGMVMPVQPMYGNGNNGGFGGDWCSWIILFLIFGMFGGWGNGGNGGFGGYGSDFPWLINGQNGINANTNAGFYNAAVQSAIGDVHNGIISGFGDVQNSLCSGFAGVNATVNGAQNAIANQLYTGQIADLERSFAAQTANTQALNGLQSQLANCCCENRAATADLKYTVATEACADRAAVNDALRNVIESNTANTQRILDQLCNDKIDAKNEKIAELQNQLNMATLRESQVAQNAFIAQGFSNEVDQLYNRLSNCPVPSTPVYGRTPIFTCNNNSCGGNFVA